MSEKIKRPIYTKYTKELKEDAVKKDKDKKSLFQSLSIARPALCVNIFPDTTCCQAISSGSRSIMGAASAIRSVL